MDAIKDLTVILPAGGQGTRLFPLTIDRSKSLIRIGNKPIIYLIAEELARQGCREFILALQGTMNRSQLKMAFEHGEGFSRMLNLEPEAEFMMSPPYENVGNADAIRIVMRYYNITRETLVVMGDSVVNLDLDSLLETHHRQDALLTIALWEVEDTTGFGVAQLAEDGRIETFVEKPPPEKAPSNLANSGIYVLSPEFCNYFDDPWIQAQIESGFFDMGYHMIPFLVEETDRVYGWNLSAHKSPYWNDVGSPERYRETTQDILMGRIQNVEFGPEIAPGIHMDETTQRRNAKGLQAGNIIFRGRALIGKHSLIGPDAVIENSVIGDTCVIEAGSEIVNSTIMGQTYIGRGVRAHGTIIGAVCSIGEGSHLRNGSVIGHGSMIAPGSVIGEHEMVAPREAVHTILETGQYNVVGSDQTNIYFYRK
ncbi:MAG: sugar phosphate nucleotidyltransferase [Candidatus Bipolaricaulia bacterium]